MNHASDPPTISEGILVKRRYNASLRLCALAPELIGRILLHARDNRLEPSTHDWLPGNWMAWLPAAHICHHIRAIALASPLLWDHIYVQRRDASLAFLERSREVPIDVRVDHRAKLNTIKDVLRQLPRIRSLVLDKSKLFESPEDASWLSPSAPHLVSLRIGQPDGYEPKYTSIPELMLRRHMPLLRSLEIRSMEWRWQDSGHLLPTTLTYLSVSGGIPWMYEKTLARKTLSVLRGLPRLESLSICDLVPRRGQSDLRFAESTDTATKVSLPRLQSLTCGGGALPSLRLLECLDIPSTCKICIKAEFADVDRGHISMLVSLLNENVCAPNAGVSPFVDLKIGRWDVEHGSLYVRAFRTERTPPSGDYMSASLPDADFMLQCGVADEDQELQWSYIIVGAVNLSSVHTLELSTLRGTGQLDYQHVLGHMPSLKTLHFGEHWGLFMVLWVLPSFWKNKDGGRDGELRVFLPRLRQLVFSHVKFTHFLYKTCGDEFVKRLRTRRLRGAGIVKITLRCCEDMTPGLAAMIRGEVSELREETCSPAEHGVMLLEQYGDSD